MLHLVIAVPVNEFIHKAINIVAQEARISAVLPEPPNTKPMLSTILLSFAFLIVVRKTWLIPTQFAIGVVGNPRHTASAPPSCLFRFPHIFRDGHWGYFGSELKSWSIFSTSSNAEKSKLPSIGTASLLKAVIHCDPGWMI